MSRATEYYGTIAYHAFRAALNELDGSTLPLWEDCPLVVRQSYERAAVSVIGVFVAHPFDDDAVPQC